MSGCRAALVDNKCPDVDTDAQAKLKLEKLVIGWFVIAICWVPGIVAILHLVASHK